MKLDDLKRIFPRASQSTIAANSELMLPRETLEAAASSAGGPQNRPDDISGSRQRQNKTEAEFGRILESQKLRGDIIEYRAFGIRLEWGKHPETQKPQVYTPDFVVWRKLRKEDGNIEFALLFIEVKGGHIWDKDRIRFRGCRSEWGMFAFEMHQKKSGDWKRIE